MDEKRYRLQGEPGILVTDRDADSLLRLGDGDAALLYLWLLRRGGELRIREAAAALRLPESRMAAAAAALRTAGLLSEGGGGPLPPADELPEYRVEDIVRRSREDPAFQCLVSEAQRNLGHALSGADLKTLFGIYDRLGLPTDVIMLAINRCAENARRRWGEGRLPTMRAIEKEAFAWANRELMTVELAEEYLARLDARQEVFEQLRKTLQISGREPTATERRYLESWLDMGFGPEALAIAYDRTVIRTNRLTWSYMDSIVRSWAEKGLLTAEDIEKGDSRGDGRRNGPARAGQTAPARRGDDLDRLEQMLERKE